MDSTTSGLTQPETKPAKPLYKGRFVSGYTDRLPRVTQIAPADVYSPIRLGPGWNESRIAFVCYQAYRDQGPTRSLDKAAELLGKPVETLERWSRQWQWQWRIAIHDQMEHERTRAPKTRERAMAEQAKLAKWGPDKRLWSRGGRARMRWLRKYAARLAKSPGQPVELVMEAFDLLTDEERHGSQG